MNMLKNTQKTAEDRNTLIKTTAVMLTQYKHALLLLKNCWKERKKVHLGFLSLLVALFSKLLHLLSELFSFTVAFFYNFHNFLPFLVDFVILPETQIKLEQWIPDVSGEEPR